MSFSNIRTKIRALLNEGSVTQKDIFTFDNSRIFTLSEENVLSVSAVFLNDSEIEESGASWSYNEDTNKLTFDDDFTLTSGDIIQVDFLHYPNYSDTELDGFIKGALAYISVHGYKTFEVNSDDINPVPTESEENLITIVSTLLIKPDNKSFKLPDITITVPISAMPTDDMIRKVIASFKRNSHGVFTVVNASECD